MSAAPRDAQRDAIDGLFEFFNARFELYGRRLVPVYVTGTATNSVEGRALAATVAASDAFAAITAPLEKTVHTPQAALVSELARNKLVTVATNVSTWWSDRAVFDALHPYVWSVFPSAEKIQAQVGAVACSLAGKKASFSTDPALAATPRKFGIVSAGKETPPSVSILSDAIEACTGEAPERVAWVSGSGGAVLRTALQRMTTAGVTTAICICEQYYLVEAVTDKGLASDREWIVPQMGYFGGDEYMIGMFYRNGWLRGGTMLVAPGPRLVPVQTRPWFGALMSTRPTLATATSSGAALNDGFVIAEPTYVQLLLLASGIQAAGPVLTPETFAQGLMTAQFPNPSAGAAPFWQPPVGFGPGDHGFYDNFSVAWWSPQLEPMDPGNGAMFRGSFCYVGQGTRFSTDAVPSDLAGRLFDPNALCR